MDKNLIYKYAVMRTEAQIAKKSLVPVLQAMIQNEESGADIAIVSKAMDVVSEFATRMENAGFEEEFDEEDDDDDESVISQEEYEALYGPTEGYTGYNLRESLFDSEDEEEDEDE